MVQVVARFGVRRRMHRLAQDLVRGVPRAYLARLDAQTPINGTVTIAVASLIAGFLLFQGHSAGVLTWAGVQVSLAALVIARWWRRPGRPDLLLDFSRSRRGLHHALAWAALSGGLWGALTFVLPHAEAEVQMALVLAMGGMAAGASATLAAVPQVAAVYILGCTVPATLYFAATGTAEGFTLAAVFSVFTVAMVAMSQLVFSALSRQFGAEWHARQLEEMGAALRESEQRFRATFQNAAVGIAHVGLDGAWLLVNDGVCGILGYTRDELHGVTFQDVTHPDDLEDDLAHFHRIIRGESNDYEMEKRYLNKQGKVVWVHLTASLQRDAQGQPMYCIAVVQNITARKQVEQALRDSDRAKDEFLAVLGHELRNPLAPLRTGLDLLVRTPRDPALVGELVPMMDRQLSHLVRLVDDLLDMSRISRGSVALQRAPLSVSAPIQAAIEQRKGEIEQRQHRLDVHLADDLPALQGDFERLTQVFSNLLANAVKYMDPGGSIRVHAAVENGDVVVRIRDTGFGIPPDRLDSLFKLFSQIPEHREATGGGLGIGLALSRKIIEMHGGSIEAVSDGRGCGSEFVVRLPVRELQPPWSCPSKQTALW